MATLRPMSSFAAEPMTVHGPTAGEFRWSIVVSEHRRPGSVDSLIRDGVARTDLVAPIQLWIRDARPEDDAVAESHGFGAYRDLWQLRCALPAEPSTIATRAFTPSDLEELVEVNNRAFHWHPEQGGQTVHDFERTMSEEWFDADGLRLHHIDGRMAGFCWTKVHRDDDPPVGEIFVIAVDPDFHGRGLGVPMTLSGLDWLSAKGLEHGMLYVESDNDAANATYTRIGFTRHRTDRAYRREPDR